MVLALARAADSGLFLLTVLSDDPVVGVASILVLLTSNIFAIAIQPLVRPRGRLRPFLVGFAVHGLVAMAAVVGGVRLLRGELVDRLVLPFLQINAVLGDALPRSMQEAGAVEVALVAVLFGLPMLAYAIFGGLLCTAFAAVVVPPQAAGEMSAGDLG
jgi:hypothetical protein